MISLRPGQDRVVEYRQGLMAVPAVPGAGKTTVLAYLAADLIAEGLTRPGKILIVTVMNSAVSNFRAKIGNFLEAKGLSRNRGFEVKTLHSLAMSILKEKPEFLLINNEFQIIDEAVQWDLITKLTWQWVDQHETLWKSPLNVKEDSKWYEKAVEKWTTINLPRYIKEMISYLKSQGLTVEDVKKLKPQVNEYSYLYWALDIFLEYSRSLYHNGLLDFDDLILQALRLLEKDEELTRRLRKRWTYIFEDEAQDSNPLQERILHLLSGKEGNLVRVGDSNQAIMGTFTSAEPRIFRNFCQQAEVAKSFILQSSRSTQEIINLANYLVKWSRSQHPQIECRSALEEQLINPVEEGDLFPNPITDDYTIAVKSYEDSQSEVFEVAKLAVRHSINYPENTLAIIVPNRYVQEEVTGQLEKLAGEFVEVGKVNSQQAKTIYDLKLVIQYLAEPHKKDKLLKLLSKVLLIDSPPEAIDSLADLFKKYTLAELIYPIGGELPWLSYPEELFDPELFASFNQALKKIQYWLDASVVIPPDELILFLAEQMELVGEPLAIAQNIAIQIKSELDLHPTWKLLDIASELPRLEPAFRRFAKVIYEQKGFEPTPGVISVITAHKSKGLEWDTVYLTSLTAAEYPSTVKDNFRSEYWYLITDRCNPGAIARAEVKNLLGEKEQIDPLKQGKVDEISERLRLLYVAITRAKKNLLLSCHKKLVFNQGFQKDVAISQPLVALNKFIYEERKGYVCKKPE